MAETITKKNKLRLTDGDNLPPVWHESKVI